MSTREPQLSSGTYQVYSTCKADPLPFEQAIVVVILKLCKQFRSSFQYQHSGKSTRLWRSRVPRWGIILEVGRKAVKVWGSDACTVCMSSSRQLFGRKWWWIAINYVSGLLSAGEELRRYMSIYIILNLTRNAPVYHWKSFWRSKDRLRTMILLRR